MALIKCKNCDYENEEASKFCRNCGQPLEQQNVILQYSNKTPNQNAQDKKVIYGIIIAVVLVIVIIITNMGGKDSKVKQKNIPPRINITMTSYYGNIDYILDELGLDFDLVTMGANCNTGVQKNEFKTEKYGVLHTEFRYCKYNETTIFRVYNDDKDQELREPKAGEVPVFDKYGKKISGTGI